MSEKIVKVGVGVMILREGKVLLGKRKNAHGAGQYAFPGGHLEFDESFANCAVRETSEEAGIEIKSINFLFLANFRAFGKHYCHVGLIADWASGEAQVLEPDKCESWDWFDLDKLPSPMFEMCERSFEAYKTKKNYFDS